jgi:tRNA 2-thiouridine synthesizing protein A
MAEIPEIADDLKADQVLDGGNTGCGELLMEMKLKMRRVPQGGILEVITLDPGAPEDLPAWCRLTGNQMLGKRILDQRRTAYFIRKEEI